MFCTLVQFQHDIDISEFLKCIRDKHEEARVYVAAQDAKLELQSIWKKLQDIEAENERCPLRSVYLKIKNVYGRCDLEGMTSKIFTQVQKLATIYTCAREVLHQMFPDCGSTVTSFTVTKVDVQAAFEIVQLSMITFKAFKVLFLLDLE